MTRRITLQVIADELGCSAKTVSNAFTRPDQLSESLRRRILATAARMGYPGPNPLAAGLRRGRVGAIGFAYANPLGYAFEDAAATTLLAGISSVAERAGAGLLLVPGSAAPTRGGRAVSAAIIDGLVISSLADDDPLLDVALRRSLPAVVIDQPDPTHVARRGDGPVPAWVGVDDHAAAKAAAAHVLALGHRELGIVSFALDRTHGRILADDQAQAAATYAVTRRRLQGYAEAIAEAGLAWSRVPVAAGTDSTIGEGAAAAATLLARQPRPTAILCLSDRLAEGVIETARAAGLRIPHDLSVVGFDDAKPAEALALTTIRQPMRRKGELAATALLYMIDGRAPAPASRLPTELVIRGSTASPPASP